MTELNDSFWVSKFYQNKNPVEQLAQFLSSIRAQFYDPGSWNFQYQLFARSDLFKEQQLFLPALGQSNPLLLETTQEQISYWLNLYNTLVLHSIAANKIRNSLKDYPDFFDTSKYKVGRFSLSLDEVEHGILRGNAHKFMGIKASFARNDPRSTLALTTTDPRIHFCLYSACNSSAGLNVFDSENLENQFTDATNEYLKKFVSISNSGKLLKIPKIFQWYKKDFGSEADLLGFILRNLEGSENYLELLADIDKVKIDYIEYDWKLNDWR